MLMYSQFVLKALSKGTATTSLDEVRQFRALSKSGSSHATMQVTRAGTFLAAAS